MLSKIKTSASNHQNWLAFLIFVVLAVIVLEANPFAGETVGPFDLLVSYSGFSSAAPPHLDVRSRRRSDILDARFPGLREHRQEFQSYLNNFKGKKLELVEKLYVMTWKPSLLIYLCVPNEARAFYFSQLIKLIIAGFGLFLFLKLFLSWPASFFGGMVYMLCGFHAAWFYWLHMETSMWIPWLLWAVALYLIHHKIRYLFLIAGASVFLINGAFPAVAAYGFYAVALFIFIYNLFNQKNIYLFFKRSITPLLFMAFGFLISSHYLLNLLNLMQTTDLSYREGAGTLLKIKEFSHLYKYNPQFSQEFFLGKSVYSGMLAFVFSALSFLYLWVKKKTDHWKSCYVFSLILLAVALVIGYGLISHEWIRKIPVFSFNPWQRMSVMIGLSMALLSSFFVDFIDHLKDKPSRIYKLAIPGLVVIFLFQFADQKRYFNQYNGPTPAKYFFPSTPSIDYMKKNIKDYQSIIADYSFNISGTLSSYSFYEWFRHSFRSKEERELLLSLAPHSDSSPTSFSISARHIDYSSPLMNLLAVRYIIINKRNISFTRAPYFFKQPFVDHIPSPPLPSNELCQHFQISEPRKLEAVNLYLGNYRNERFSSDVLVKLYDSQSSELIAVSKKDKKYIKDNTWVYFEFEEPAALKKGEYEFTLELADPKAPVMLSGWSTEKTEGIHSYLTVNGEKTDLSFKYFLHEANDIYKKNYKVHRLEPAVAVVENIKCPEGPYLISEINQYPPRIIKNSLEYESSLGSLTIHIPKEVSGYVVIPRSLDHYAAYVDGEKKPIEMYLDVIPAVYVKNNSQIFIKEKRFFPLTGFLISFFSLLFFVILFFFLRKKKNF